MSEQTSYAPGTPCWSDAMTPDLEGAMAFYGELFGWTFDTGSIERFSYTPCLKNGRPVAGLGTGPPGSNIPPAWNTYLASGDADTTARLVRSGGGQILAGPDDVEKLGRFMMAADSTGAPVGFWQGGELIGAELTGEPGTMVWNELHTTDGARADQFYGSLFPYEVQPMSDGTYDYAVLKINGREVAGRYTMPPDEANRRPSQWVVYFGVLDTDNSISRTAELGGAVVGQPSDTPYGRMAECRDPYGANFCVISIEAQQ